MDMIVKSRVCRYEGREYQRGETIPNVAPNHARVLTTLGKAEEAPTAPAGRVAETRPLPLDEPAPTRTGAPKPAATAEVADEAPAPARRRKRGEYQTRALKAGD